MFTGCVNALNAHKKKCTVKKIKKPLNKKQVPQVTLEGGVDTHCDNNADVNMNNNDNHVEGQDHSNTNNDGWSDNRSHRSKKSQQSKKSQSQRSSQRIANSKANSGADEPLIPELAALLTGVKPKKK